MVRHLKPMRSMQDLLLGSIRFLHYINDRSKTILKSLVNIYAHDTTVYGYLDGPSMFSGLWSDQALAVQWEKKKLAYKFSSSPCWLWILTSYDDWLHYQRSSFLWETIESQVHSRHQVELMHTINRQRRWKKIDWLLIPLQKVPHSACHALYLQESYQTNKWIIAAISVLELLHFFFPNLTAFRSG